MAARGFPPRWLDNIENAEHSRDEIASVAERLATLDLM